MNRGIALVIALLLFVSPAVVQAQQNAPSHDEGVYFDTTGRVVSFQRAYDSWFKAHPKPHYLRAAGEVVFLVGAGTAYYWLRANTNKVDWDRPNLVDRLLFEAVRFDNNYGTTNYILHPLGGAAYYGFSRVNDIGIYGSFAYAFATSTIWEYAFEWRELVSINDLIFTPFGGLAMGEFLYQLGEYLNSSSDTTPARETATVALGWPRLVHNAIDGKRPREALEPDSLGYSSAFSHRFLVAYEYARTRNDTGARGETHNAIVEAQIVAMPGFLRPGKFGVNFENGNFTDMAVRIGYDDTGLADADLWFEADLLGHYAQDIELRSDGLYGHATMVALSSALRYSQHWLLGDQDEFAVSHMAGPAFRLWTELGRIKGALYASSHFDFASIVSLAYPDWTARFGEQGTKSSLQKEGYQFHLGGSARLSMSASYRPIEIGGYGSYGRYGSIQGLDREQETVTHDLAGTEQVLEYGGYAGFAVPPLPIYARVGIERYERWSALGGISVHRWDDLYGVTAGLRF